MNQEELTRTWQVHLQHLTTMSSESFPGPMPTQALAGRAPYTGVHSETNAAGPLTSWDAQHAAKSSSSSNNAARTCTFRYWGKQYGVPAITAETTPLDRDVTDKSQERIKRHIAECDSITHNDAKVNSCENCLKKDKKERWPHTCALYARCTRCARIATMQPDEASSKPATIASNGVTISVQ